MYEQWGLKSTICFVCIIGLKDCFGEQFLISIFADSAISTLQQQELLISNSEANTAVVVIEENGHLSRLNLTGSGNYTYPINLTNVSYGKLAYRTIRINSSSSVQVKGVFKSNGYKLHYNINSVTYFGTTYYTSYGMGFKGNSSQCCIVAEQTTKLHLKSLNNIAFSTVIFNKSQDNVTEEDFVLPSNHSLCLWSSLGIYNIFINASKPVALFCGEYNGINHMRVHLPPINICGKSYFLPCFEDNFVTDNTTEGQVQRIIKIYPIYPNTTAYVNGVQNNLRQEIQTRHPIDVTGDKAVCVAQYIRKWSSAPNTFFKDDDYSIIIHDPAKNFSHESCDSDRNSTNLKEQMHATTKVPMANPAAQNCRCPCAGVSHMNMTTTEKKRMLQESLERIQKELAIKKSVLNSIKRAKGSAADKRPSATGLGVIGVAVLLGVVVTIVVFDYPVLSEHSQMWWCKVSRGCKKRTSRSSISK